MIQDIFKDTEALQKEMHEVISRRKSENPKLEYQDLVTVFLLYKISELQRQVADLSSRSYPTLK